jgi:preprotein translocase subunit SecG
MLYYVFAIMYVVSCLLLLLVVLLQQGKGGDMASAIGGGSSQTAFGARAGATILTKATSVLGVLFMIGAIALGIIGKRGETSLMGGFKAPAAQPAPAPLSAPAPAKSPEKGQTPEKAPAPAPEKK